MQRPIRIVVSLAVALLVAAALVPLSSPASAQPRRGGAMRIAYVSDPPTLDIHWTTATMTMDIGVHLFEGLFALNANFEPRPLLVEDWKLSPSRQLYTFNLRRGVPFHHGREMDSEDVVASLQRWGRVSARGRELFRDTVSLTATDRYTIELRLREPNAMVPLMLAMPGQGAMIYPKEVIEEAGTGMVRRFIGTGPYRLVEQIPDRHVRLDRFDQYRPLTEAPSGMAGRREAHLDTLYFLGVPDPAVRIAMVVRNEIQFAEVVPHDEYQRIRGIRGVTPFIQPVPSWHAFIFNHRAGIMRERRIRQAFLLALDAEAVMRGVYGPPQFWQMNPGIMPRGHPLWNDAGKELYNQKNPERARRLLAEAGYRGEPIRLLTTSEYIAHITSAEIAKPQLEKAGFVVDLQVFDWSTVVTRRMRPEMWDVSITRFAFVPDPVQLLSLLPEWPGWYDNRDMQAHVKLMRRHTDPKVRREIWTRAQRLFYEDAATVKLGDWTVMHLLREEVRGMVGGVALYFWNVWQDRR